MDPVGNLFIHGFPEAENGRFPAMEKSTENQNACANLRLMRVANAESNIYCHFCGWSFGEVMGEEGSPRARHRPRNHRRQPHRDYIGRPLAEALYSKREHGKEADEIIVETGKSNVLGNGTKDEIPLTTIDKRAILRRGLFDGKRPLFEEAVRG